ncbi:hypothetical protein MBLNU459_g0440t1 [Dothideomycetes sp. NU459]
MATRQQMQPHENTPLHSGGSPDSLHGSGANNKSHTDHIDNTPQQWWPQAGYGPLARIQTDGSARLPAFGGAFQPGLYRPPKTSIANPAPLGLSGFALTTFVLSLVNLNVYGLGDIGPNIVVGPAYAYGGLVQLLAGMWEMAVGNTFGATALASYGGFWISLGIIFTPGGFEIVESYGGENGDFFNAFGLFIMGWMIFTFILWLLTIRSTLAFSSLLFFVWLTFLMLGIGYLDHRTVGSAVAPNSKLVEAGGAFGIIAAFIAWWNMLAGIAEPSNSFFLVPVLHFPWSEKGRQRRQSVVDAEKQE